MTWEYLGGRHEHSAAAVVDGARFDVSPTSGPLPGGAAGLRAMSFDVFFQGFRNGDSAPISGEALQAVLGPFVLQEHSNSTFWRVRAADGGEADVYGVARAAEGVMINRIGQGQALDLVVEFAVRAGAVMLAPGCPVMITEAGQERDLPEDLKEDVRFVRSGSDFSEIVALP